MKKETPGSPGYYAIITADVRYDKRLSAMAKLIFAELSALVNVNGFAHPSNNFLSELYDVSKSTIIRILNQLKELGYIYTEETITSKGTFRKIFINTNPKSLENKNDLEPSVKNDTPPSVKNDTPLSIYTNTRDIPIQDIRESIVDSSNTRVTHTHVREANITLSLIEKEANILQIKKSVYEKFYFYYKARNWISGDGSVINVDNLNAHLKIWNAREIEGYQKTRSTVNIENQKNNTEPAWLDEVLDELEAEWNSYAPDRLRFKS